MWNHDKPSTALLRGARLRYFLSPFCAFCEADREDRDFALCRPCREAVAKLGVSQCVRCGEPFESPDPTPRSCLACEQSPPAFSWARSLFSFSGVLREHFIAYKYKGDLGRERAFGDLFEEGIRALDPHFLEKIDAVLPAPPDPSRGPERGFSPPLRLARFFARQHRLPLYWNSVIRSDSRPSQAGLSLSERRANLQKVFALASPREQSRLAGKRVLIIDDVWTTGTTARTLAAFLVKTLEVESAAVLTLARRLKYF